MSSQRLKSVCNIEYLNSVVFKDINVCKALQNIHLCCKCNKYKQLRYKVTLKRPVIPLILHILEPHFIFYIEDECGSTEKQE